jgi:hypothetical protein
MKKRALFQIMQTLYGSRFPEHCKDCKHQIGGRCQVGKIQVKKFSDACGKWVERK